MVLKKAIVQRSGLPESRICGAITGFGAAMIRKSAGVAEPCEAANQDSIIGFAVEPADNVVLDEDGFYQAVNNSSIPDLMRMITSGEVRALVVTSAATSIVEGDFLETADLGDHSYHTGVLEEAGAGGNVGETNVLTAVAKAMEDCTMAAASYQTPDAVSVSVGDKTITFAVATLALLDLHEGDYIILEDLDGAVQLNRVKSLTSTVITLQLASTVALTATTDYVRKVFQVRCKILN
jgi:hypothetical protein